MSHVADELEAASAEDMAARANPAYVRARGILDDIEMFEKALRQPASQTDYRSWLAATTEKYRQWLSRL